MIEDKALALSLYSATEVVRPIPAEFYRAVAEIVHHPAEEGGMGLQKPIGELRRRPDGPFSRERIIASALVDVASELRLTDATELVALIRNDEAANIADLINSSTELFFKSGTLRYALSSSVKAPWDGTPVVALDMEFRHARVSAFFRLTIGRRHAGVEITDILFDEKGLDERAKAERLAEALAGARVLGRRGGRPRAPCRRGCAGRPARSRR